MEDTRTRFCEAIPASRRASSKEVKRSLCLPTPLVKKSFFGTMLFPNFYVPSVSLNIVIFVERSRMSLSHPGGQEQHSRRFHRTFISRGERPASLGEQRIDPSPPRKASKVVVGGAEHPVVLDDSRGFLYLEAKCYAPEIAQAEPHLLF